MKLYRGILLFFGLSIVTVSFAAAVPAATSTAIPVKTVAVSTAQIVTEEKHPLAHYKGTKTYYAYHGEYGAKGQITVKQFHHKPTSGKSHILMHEGENHYAVDANHVALEWLNRNTRGDIFQEGAHVYHTETGEHLGMFALRPGDYLLNFTHLNKVEEMDGYKLLKKEMKGRVELIPPKGPGHYVGIRILPPK